jgi:hypothetical protein
MPVVPRESAQAFTWRYFEKQHGFTEAVEQGLADLEADRWAPWDAGPRAAVQIGIPVVLSDQARNHPLDCVLARGRNAAIRRVARIPGAKPDWPKYPDCVVMIVRPGVVCVHRIRESKGDRRLEIVALACASFPTTVSRLLWHVSWGGNANPYRAGGQGLEDVLTAEVFQALDFLPRGSFIRKVLDGAHGARETMSTLTAEVEDIEVAYLPGDIPVCDPSLLGNGPHVQPDVILRSPSVLCFVEAKRTKSGGSFQFGQLAREYLAVCREARNSHQKPLLLLVLPKEPPFHVGKVGPRTIGEELSGVTDPCGPDQAGRSIAHAEEPEWDGVVAYVTWHEIQRTVQSAVEGFGSEDDSVVRTVRRLAKTLQNSVDWHSLQFEKRLDQ